MNDKERKEILITLCDQVTSEILRKNKSLTHQCGRGAEKLVKLAKLAGIKLVIQGGFWDKYIEHNWCVDPIDGSMYDPTAEQFMLGKNGLQTEETIKFYSIVESKDIPAMIRHACMGGFTSRFTEGFSQIAMGRDIREKKLEILDMFKKYYPDCVHVVHENRGHELRIAKNGCFYGIIRFNKIEFKFDEFNIIEQKNKVCTTQSQIRSFVVFKNENNSYSIQEIEQRLFVTRSGKTGLITTRGTKTRGYKLSKSGNLYKTEAKKNLNKEIQFITSKIEGSEYLGMILELEEMIANHNKERN